MLVIAGDFYRVINNRLNMCYVVLVSHDPYFCLSENGVYCIVSQKIGSFFGIGKNMVIDQWIYRVTFFFDQPVWGFKVV
jgi:hypothetical protein